MLLFTVSFLVFYRVYTGIQVLHSTFSLRKAVFQLLDIEILETAYVSFILRKSGPSDPQKWIQMNHAYFQSAPMCVIQLVFLFRSTDLNVLVCRISFFFVLLVFLCRTFSFCCLPTHPRGNQYFTHCSM